MSNLDVQQYGHVAVITMNNPPANTWTIESLREFKDLVRRLKADPYVYSLVITGQGDKYFSAGADLHLFADSDSRKAAEVSELFGEAFETLASFRGVSVAAINGYALGGGLEVALACDIRIAGESSVLGLPEASVGLLPCAGGTQNLAWLVGEGWAKRMILCGEKVNADRALKIGLVEEIVPDDVVLDVATSLAHRVENQSPESVAACKYLIQSSRSRPLSSGYKLERDAFVDLFSTEDQKEGVNAFLEKRSPRWVNR